MKQNSINIIYCFLICEILMVFHSVLKTKQIQQYQPAQESLALQPESALYNTLYQTDQNEFLKGSKTGSVQEITIEMAWQQYQQLQIYDSLVTVQINQCIKDYDVTQETMVHSEQLQDIIAMISTSKQAFLKYVEAEMMLTGAEVGNGSLRFYYEYKKGMELISEKIIILKTFILE